MRIIATLRKIYRRFVHLPLLDRAIYKVLDFLTNILSYLYGYSFPDNYIRRWKLDMLWELYEPETVALFKKIIKPDMVIVDIGAHIGYFTRIFSMLVGKNGMVHAFEADPENFELLKKNTKHLKNIKIYQTAISDHTGTIDFYHCEEKAGCHSTLPNQPLDFKMRKIRVQAETLDSFLTRENVGQVDVIKMDIEGGEPKAVDGMKDTLSQDKNIALVMEFAPAWIKKTVNPLDFLKKIASYGFDIFAILPNKLEKIDSESEGDYEKFIPESRDGTAYNQFINLYCKKNNNLL